MSKGSARLSRSLNPLIPTLKKYKKVLSKNEIISPPETTIL